MAPDAAHGAGTRLGDKSLVWGPREVWPDEAAMARAEAKHGSFALIRAERLLREAELPEPSGYRYHHAAGSAPQQQLVVQGETVNLYRWRGQVLGEIGYGSKMIGIDGNGALELGISSGPETARINLTAREPHAVKTRPTSGLFALMADALPEAWFIGVSDILMRSRIIKYTYEQRLIQRAMNYFAEIHAFVRNYILERGTAAYDYGVANTARLWGMHRIMRDVSHHGDPYEVVGIDVAVACRSGKVTAYPHPSQLWWSRTRRGDALQFAGRVLIGGYGVEFYRSYLIAPWTDWQAKVWDVHTGSSAILARESYAGNTCSNVAKAVLAYQVRQRCAHLLYHRPRHGEGMEVHPPPYIALGDYTVLEEGMCFTNKPGLYDPENGFGFNHSDTILVGKTKGRRMGLVPLSREWSFLHLER